MSFRLESFNTKTINLLTTTLIRELISVNSDIMEEVTENLNIESKSFARRSRTMRDILLAEDAAKSAAGRILTTKSVRLQRDYVGSRERKVILHGMSLYISLEHLFFFSFFSEFGEVASVSTV